MTDRISTSAEAAESRVRVECINQLYSRAPIGLSATGFNAALVTLVLWGRVSPVSAVVWFACQASSVVVRFGVYRRFLRMPPTGAREVEKWLLRFRIGAVTTGLLWGSAAIFLYPHGSLPHQIFLAFVLGGMVAGASGLYPLDLTSFAIYSALSLTPVILQLLWGGTVLHLAMGAMLVLFALLMSWLAVQNNRSILTSLRLRAQNEDLVASLTAEKDRVERLNVELSEEIVERKSAEEELRRHRNHLEELVEKRARGLAAANRQLLEVITEREKAQRHISRIAREWTSTFDNMRDMVAIVSRDMKIARANAALARFVSMHPRELVGKPCHEVLHGRSEPWPGCPHAEALRTHSPITREINDPRHGVPLLVTCSPFLDEDGKVIGTVHVARDISEQKGAERKREELIAQLQEAMANVKLLSGLLPICASCKKIRDDQGYWTQLEEYLHEHSEVEFTHGLCPECAAELYPKHLKKG